MNERSTFPLRDRAGKADSERKISSVDLMDAHLEQIAAVNPALNAAVEVLAHRAHAGARDADGARPEGPFHGVPFRVKDLIELEGTRCTGGMARTASRSISQRRVERGKTSFQEKFVSRKDRI